jgi:hypothetical protein
MAMSSSSSANIIYIGVHGNQVQAHQVLVHQAQDQAVSATTRYVMQTLEVLSLQPVLN